MLLFADAYNEITLLITGGIIVFLVLTGTLLFVFLFYQKKRFQHSQRLLVIEKEFSEELLKSRIEIQEHTFNAISEEIHDNVGQLLSLAKMQLHLLEQSQGIDRTATAELKGTLNDAISDLRSLSKSLNSEWISSFDLVKSVQAEMDRITRLKMIDAKFLIEGEPSEISEQKRMILFRIIQECIQNIIKHAEATEIRIRFQFSLAQLTILITDNGKGFEPVEVKAGKKGLGLQNLSHRATLIEAQISIESATGKGTNTKILLPHS